MKDDSTSNLKYQFGPSSSRLLFSPTPRSSSHHHAINDPRHAQADEEGVTGDAAGLKQAHGATQQARADRQAADAEPLENPAVEQIANRRDGALHVLHDPRVQFV